MEPKPVQKPHLPLWFGGHHENALKRAVNYGNGWMGAGSSSSNAFIRQSAMIRQFLADAQRDPATFSYGRRIYICVDGNKERGEQRIRQWLARRSEMPIWGLVLDLGQRRGMHGKNSGDRPCGCAVHRIQSDAG